MSILIIGGTGFIGRHLCEALHQDRLIATTASYNPNLDFLYRYAPSVRGLDISSKEVRTEFAQAKVVVYLAHRSRPSSNPQATHHEIEFNVAETIRVIREILETNPQCRIIYASTGGQIYGSGRSHPITEKQLAKPMTTYSLGKHLIEQSLHFFERTLSAQITILRIANPVGRWQLDRAHGFVSAVVRAARSGRPVTIYGDGNNKRDYFDADELAAFLVSLCVQDQNPSGVFNIGSGLGWTEREILELVSQTLDLEVPHQFSAPRAFDLPYAVLDITRARKDLGWSPVVPLSDTIIKLYDWAKPN